MECFRQYLEELKATLGRLPLASVQRVCDVLFEAYEDDRSVLILGNGGNAALASHMVCDLGKGSHAPNPDSEDIGGAKRF